MFDECTVVVDKLSCISVERIAGMNNSTDSNNVGLVCHPRGLEVVSQIVEGGSFIRILKSTSFVIYSYNNKQGSACCW